jgi:hypothetical protein
MTGTIACSLTGFKLLASLLTVANAIVCTKGNLLAVGQQNLFTAFHQVLLIKCPGIHEVLQHDHEDVPSKSLNIESI